MSSKTGNLKELLTKWLEGEKIAEETLARRLSFRILHVAKPQETSSNFPYCFEQIAYAFTSQILFEQWKNRTKNECTLIKLTGQELCTSLKEGSKLSIDSGENYGEPLSFELVKKIAEYNENEDEMEFETGIQEIPNNFDYGNQNEVQFGGQVSSSGLQEVSEFQVNLINDNILNGDQVNPADFLEEDGFSKQESQEIYQNLIPKEEMNKLEDFQAGTPSIEDGESKKGPNGETLVLNKEVENINDQEWLTKENSEVEVKKDIAGKILRTWSEETRYQPTELRKRPAVFDQFGKPNSEQQTMKKENAENEKKSGFISGIFSRLLG